MENNMCWKTPNSAYKEGEIGRANKTACIVQLNQAANQVSN